MLLAIEALLALTNSYIVDWLPPNFGAVGQYGAIFARDLAVARRDVRLIGLTTGDHSTTRELLPNGKVFETTRIHSSIYEKSGFVTRLLWTCQTNTRLVYEVIRDFRSSQAELIFTGAPPFMLFFIIFAKMLCRDAGLPAYGHVEVGDIDGFAAALDRLAQLTQSRPFAHSQMALLYRAAAVGIRRQSVSDD